MFLTDFEACATALFVASSQLSLELAKTSITFNTDIVSEFYVLPKDKQFEVMLRSVYPLSATTSLTLSPSIFLSMVSIPFFKVKVEEGHPLQAP